MQADIIVIPSLATPVEPVALVGSTWLWLLRVAHRGRSRTNSDRILIVEDDLLIASQMEAALTDAGFEIVGTASTGERSIATGGRAISNVSGDGHPPRRRS